MAIYREFSVQMPFKDEVENNNYVSHIFLNGLFTGAELIKIDGLWNDDTSMPAGVFTPGSSKEMDYEKRNSKKIYIPSENNEWIYDKIGSMITLLNAGKFRFALNGFQGPLSFNLYEAGCFFDWHMDYGPGTYSNRKLVVVIQLSEEDKYEGGELQVVSEAITAPKIRGSIAIFPSYVIHRVTPVISGQRKSLVAHIGGPAFR
jgi:hypothetical protein